jgi:hypothetical protein
MKQLVLPPLALLLSMGCTGSIDGPLPARGGSAGQVAASGGANATASGGGGAGGGASGSGNPSGGANASGSGGKVNGAGGTSSSSSGAGGLAVSGGGSAGQPTGSGGAGSPVVGCPRACGPTYEQFFDEAKLATLRVKTAGATPTYSSAAHCPPFTWTSAQMKYESPDGVGDITLEKVGFRFRGSRVQPVQGFKLDLQVLDTPGPEGKRRFADLNRVNILSNEGDATHIIQCAGYKAMRDFGIPSPRCNLMKVYLNDKYYGLLQSVEQVNKGYVRRHFGTNAGSLYGASPSMGDCAQGGFKDSAAKLQYSGDSFSSYQTQYQLTHATAAEAEQNLIPMLKCADATQTPDEAAYKKCISEWIDVEEWLKVIAAESLMPELESFIGFYRNYYLYFKADPTAPHQGRFVVWPWDIDSSLNLAHCTPSDCNVTTSVSNLYGPRNARAPFVTRLTTAFKADYCTTMKSFMSTVFKPALVSGLAQVAEAGMMNDPTDSASEWQTAVSSLTSYMTTHATAAQTTITAACP